jgi:hypothetical protein
MRTLNGPRSHATAANQTRRRSPLTEPRPSRRASLQLISDGVLASYIHDIAQRHRRSFTPERQGPGHIPDPLGVMEVDPQTDE